MIRKSLRASGLIAAFCVILGACGGGGTGTSTGDTAGAQSSTTGSTNTTTVTAAANVMPITVGYDINGQYPNMIYTSVTICVPGTSTCQTIPNVQVDTGSTGLRLLASQVKIALPGVHSPTTGNAISECAAFADGVVWGQLALADVKLSGRTASGQSMQLIQDTATGPAVPASCAAQGATEDTQALLGANGILGIGVFLQDCGPYCASNTAAEFFDCPSGSSTCSDTVLSTGLQPSNVVANFSLDNNGVVLQLPAVALSGAAGVSGSMIFGIGTQTNNLQTGPVLAVPATGATAGQFTALYNGTSLPYSFIDSGSGALYFDDSSMATCSSNTSFGDLSSLYCPGTTSALSTLTLSATLTGSNSVSASVSLALANATYLLTQSKTTGAGSFNDLGGPAGATLAGSFDFGVPFFFGKSVFTAFEQRTTPNGAGPYFSYQ